MDSMWFLMLGHFLGDYALQSDWMARQKGTNPQALILHVSIYTVTLVTAYSGGLLLTGRDLVPAGLMLVAFAGVFVLHNIQDLIKARFHSCSRQAYYLDQVAHVVQLFIIRLWLG